MAFTGISLFIKIVACVCRNPCIVVAGNPAAATIRLKMAFNRVEIKGSAVIGDISAEQRRNQKM